jgi:hypothetical protein
MQPRNWWRHQRVIQNGNASLARSDTVSFAPRRHPALASTSATSTHKTPVRKCNRKSLLNECFRPQHRRRFERRPKLNAGQEREKKPQIKERKREQQRNVPRRAALRGLSGMRDVVIWLVTSVKPIFVGVAKLFGKGAMRCMFMGAELVIPEWSQEISWILRAMPLGGIRIRVMICH